MNGKQWASLLSSAFPPTATDFSFRVIYKKFISTHCKDKAGIPRINASKRQTGYACRNEKEDTIIECPGLIQLRK